MLRVRCPHKSGAIITQCECNTFLSRIITNERLGLFSLFYYFHSPLQLFSFHFSFLLILLPWGFHNTCSFQWLTFLLYGLFLPKSMDLRKLLCNMIRSLYYTVTCFIKKYKKSQGRILDNLCVRSSKNDLSNKELRNWLCWWFFIWITQNLYLVRAVSGVSAVSRSLIHHDWSKTHHSLMWLTKNSP